MSSYGLANLRTRIWTSFRNLCLSRHNERMLIIAGTSAEKSASCPLISAKIVEPRITRPASLLMRCARLLINFGGPIGDGGDLPEFQSTPLTVDRRAQANFRPMRSIQRRSVPRSQKTDRPSSIVVPRENHGRCMLMPVLRHLLGRLPQGTESSFDRKRPSGATRDTSSDVYRPAPLPPKRSRLPSVALFSTACWPVHARESVRCTQS